MKIHEYQSKELFKNYNIPVPLGKLAYTSEEAITIAKDLIGIPCVIKAQVHSGARGKAGGIKLAHSLDEVKTISNQILGMEIKNIQTGGKSKKVRKVLVEQAVQIDKELYLSITIDRSKECIVIIASPAGGMDIEEIAEKSPELIYKANIDIRTGIKSGTLDSLANKFSISTDFQKQFKEIIQNLYRLFVEKDCSLVEINPLVISKDRIIALDGKINFDDNALFRHAEILELRDIDEENPLEVDASKFRLNYIKLDGSIGCFVNGAGLAMATMDVVKLAGLKPANFLDVGGGASSENIENAFRIILSDKNVKIILINIFGGILRCDVLAKGIKNAVLSLKVNIPVIVRLEGTNKDIGSKILEESGLKFIVANSLKHAAELLQEYSEVVKG